MSDGKDRLILEHYRKIAQLFGEGPRSTMEDLYVRDSEVNFIFSEIERFSQLRGENFKLMDVGCGNGYLLSAIREKFPKIKLVGVEFTPELFEIAKNRGLHDVDIILGDCRHPNFYKEKVDFVITERVIINILSSKQQYDAVFNIADLLNENGRYVMIESFKEPLVELNQARKEMGIDERVVESKQNKYIYENMLTNLEKRGLFEIEGTFPRNFLSSHFYITRVFHKALRPEGGKVKFSRFSEFFRGALPPAIGNYAPILFRVLEKRSP